MDFYSQYELYTVHMRTNHNLTYYLRIIADFSIYPIYQAVK